MQGSKINSSSAVPTGIIGEMNLQKPSHNSLEVLRDNISSGSDMENPIFKQDSMLDLKRGR